MGDFEDVERLQAGIREWLLRSARHGRHELRGIQGRAMLPMLCAAAFGPVLSDVGASGVPRIGVLSSVRADALAEVLGDAVTRARSAHAPGTPTRADLQREISRSIKQAIDTDDIRSDIAMVLREIDAGGTMLRASIEAGQEEVEREVLAAVEAVSAEFGEMEFMLADLARAAGEIQDSLHRQRSELRAADEQAGRQSADVRLIREELAVIEQRASQFLTGPDPSAEADGSGPSTSRWAGACPYRGLLPYDQFHAPVFFGRERLTAELVGRLAEAGIVVVIGASGTGKTSLLQAGLRPALYRGVQVPGSAAWLQVSLAPGAQPLTELAARLASLGGQDAAAIQRSLTDAPGEANLLIRDLVLSAPGRVRHAGQDNPQLVLIVDQFEQAFAASEPERAAFIEAICAAAAPAGPALTVIAVRGDYWDRCAGYPGLLRVMQHHQFIVGPMAEAGLRRAISGPAEASGLRVDPTLTDAILADLRAVGGEPGPLPLLSQAMMLTWNKREGDRLTLGSYHNAGLRGQITRAVEIAAEATYADLPENTQALARDMFRRLTITGDGHRAVGRAATRAELIAACPKGRRPQAGAVLEALAQGGLLALDADTVEVAHDALLQAWPRLRDWLEEDQSSLILYRQLAEDAARWREHGKDPAVLYRGVRLAAARQAARVRQADPGSHPALTDDESAFLRASDRAAARGRWGRRALAAALAAAVIAALAGAGLAVRSARNTASQQRTAAESGRLAAQSTALDGLDPVTASLLAGAAWQIAPTAQARYSLLQSLAQPVRGILAPGSGAVTALAYAPGGRMLAVGYADKTIRSWDLASHHLVSTATWRTPALALAFTGGGKTLEFAAPGAVGSWNLAGGTRVAARPLAGMVAGTAVAFSPDGSMLATGGSDGNVRLWDPATQQEIGAPMSSNLRPVDAVTFSPDGKTVAAASSDGTVQLWDTATRQEDGPAMVAGSAAVKALAFSPDGKLLATGGDDGGVRLWAVATFSQVGTTMTTPNPVAALAFDARGTTLASAVSNGTTELWDVATQSQTGAPLAAQGSAAVGAVAFGAGGLATGNGSGTVQLWDPALFHRAAAPLAVGIPGGRGSAALGGDVLAVADGHGTVRLWNTSTGRRTGSTIAGHHAVTALALSANGRILAVAAGGVQLWSTMTGRPVGGPVLAPDAVAVAVSPDGRTPRLLATLGRNGEVTLRDIGTGRQTAAFMTAAGAGALAFGPGGSTLATADADGTTRVWDTATGQEIGPPMTAGTAPVYAVAFGPGGSTLATADADGTTRLWDVAFPSQLLAAACSIAGRSLTRQQWADYAGTQPFQQVCPTGH